MDHDHELVEKGGDTNTIKAHPQELTITSSSFQTLNSLESEIQIKNGSYVQFGRFYTDDVDEVNSTQLETTGTDNSWYKKYRQKFKK